MGILAPLPLTSPMELPSNGQPRPDEDRRPPLIPPHIGWPLLVVLLLAMSIGAAVFTVYAAMSDGGVQLVEDAP